MEIVIGPDGSARCIYAESVDLSTFGRVRITRASHVEPSPDGQWLSDLSPVGGPLLGPFGKRSEALRAELEWLRSNWLDRS